MSIIIYKAGEPPVPIHVKTCQLGWYSRGKSLLIVISFNANMSAATRCPSVLISLSGLFLTTLYLRAIKSHNYFTITIKQNAGLCAIFFCCSNILPICIFKLVNFLITNIKLHY